MMTEHAGHLAMIIVPLLIVAFFRFRKLFPVAAMLLLLHHHLDPLPGSLSPTPPPICCTAAQSVEPAPSQAPTTLPVLFSIRPTVSPRKSQGFLPTPPAIRAPPVAGDLTPPASWTPVFRAV
jgi:hypothetical protein